MKTISRICIALFFIVSLNVFAEPHKNFLFTDTAKKTESSPFSSVFKAYFELKDELVKSDAATAALKATELSKQLKAADITKMTSKQQAVWKKVQNELVKTSDVLSNQKGIEEQRQHFFKLSSRFTQLAKVADLGFPVYLQHCPMYHNGAEWLSNDSQIMNPYYGEKMLECGNVVTTIK